MPHRLICMAFLLAALPVHAAIIGRQPALCPCCGAKVSMPIVAQSDNDGGVDRDLHARSGSGVQHVHFFVASCTACLYSGYPRDFLPVGSRVPSLTAEQQQRVRDAVAPFRAGLPDIKKPGDSLQIEHTTRYALAYAVAGAMGKSDEARAWLAIRHAWSIREQMNNIPQRPRYELMLKHLMASVPVPADGNQADRGVLMGQLAAAERAVANESPADRLMRRTFGAYLLRRHGELLAFEATAAGIRTEAAALEHAADPADPAATQPTALADAIAAVRADLANLESTIADERKWLHRAAQHFRAALRDEHVSPQNRPTALYLIGELARRLGRRDDALHYFDRAAKLGLPEQLNRWCNEQRTIAAALPVQRPTATQPTNSAVGTETGSP